MVNFQDSNIINNWENNSADALQPIFWTISTIKKLPKITIILESQERAIYYWINKQPNCQKKQISGKEKTDFHPPIIDHQNFFVPLGKIGPKGTPSTTTTSSWENNHEYQYHPLAITPDLTISFSQKCHGFRRENVKENIYTTKNSSSLTFTYKTANFDRMPDLINGGTSEGGTYFKLPRLCPYKEPSRIADYTYLHSKTYYYYYLLTYYVYYILLITLLLL